MCPGSYVIQKKCMKGIYDILLVILYSISYKSAKKKCKLLPFSICQIVYDSIKTPEGFKSLATSKSKRSKDILKIVYSLK